MRFKLTLYHSTVKHNFYHSNIAAAGLENVSQMRLIGINKWHQMLCGAATDGISVIYANGFN